jgi:L-iditol 2-dehydrogenase
VRALAKVAPGPGNLVTMERELPPADGHDVVIDVAACGVCGSDLHLQRATLGFVESAFPLWLGHEYAGTVAAVGELVDTVSVGDAVTAEPSVGCGRCRACQEGHPNVCPARRFDGGGFAPKLRVPDHRVHRLPDGMSVLAGALAEPLACAVHAVIEVGGVSAGDVVGVIGPGPIGLLTSLVARAQGASVLLVGRASSAARIELARSLGIEHVIRIPATDARSAISDLTDGHGADRVFGCAGGGEALGLGLDMLRRRGTYVELGIGTPADGVDMERVVTHELRLKGAVSHTPSTWRRALELVRQDLVAAETLERLVTARYPLDRWEDAFAAAAGKREGKVVIEPGVAGGGPGGGP